MFDLNNDGFIDGNDLRGTFRTMGMDITDKQVAEMLADGSQPMDFDSFAMMMCFKTMELEPEIVLLEALSKWDERCQGVISLERCKTSNPLSEYYTRFFFCLSHRLFTHLTNYNNTRLSPEEAKAALEEAPLVNKTQYKGLESAADSWIDYPLWIEKISGFRKANFKIYEMNFGKEYDD